MLALLLLFLVAPLALAPTARRILNNIPLRQKRRLVHMQGLSDRRFLRAHIARALYTTRPEQVRI